MEFAEDARAWTTRPHLRVLHVFLYILVFSALLHLVNILANRMPERKTRGAFIVVEGLDRSGKSTQVSLLEERLKAAGVSVRLVKFPGE